MSPANTTDLTEEKVLRSLVAQIQPVMVDELLLPLQPVAPAHIADLLVHPETELVLERLERHRGPGLAAAHTGDRRHALKIATAPARRPDKM